MGMLIYQLGMCEENNELLKIRRSCLRNGWDSGKQHMSNVKFVDLNVNRNSLITMSNLNNEHVDEHRYFVMTEDIIPNLGYFIVAKLNSLKINDLVFLSNGNTDTYAFLLLRKPSSSEVDYQKISFPGRRKRNTPVFVDDEIFTILKSSVIDTVVIGNPTLLDKNQLSKLVSLYPLFVPCRHIFPELKKQESSTILYAMNQSSTPFKLDSWKIGPTSPGKLNICDANEFIIQELRSTELSRTASTCSSAPSEACPAANPDLDNEVIQLDRLVDIQVGAGHQNAIPKWKSIDHFISSFRTIWMLISWNKNGFR